MKPLVIFGVGDIAELADFYFREDGGREVAAFTLDGQYIEEDSLRGRPVVAFEEIEKSFPPDQFDFFVALSYTQLNALRAAKVAEGKAKGYGIASYLSTKATIWRGFELGENCFILEDNTLQPFCSIGDNVTLWSGNHIGHHSRIDNHCFIASHVVVSGGVHIGESCFVGVNVTIRDHVEIGERCILGAGCLISRNAEPLGVYKAPEAERAKVTSDRLKRI